MRPFLPLFPPSAGLAGWNPINPQGNASVSGTLGQTCTVTSERISGNSACGAAISKQGHSHGKWYAEIVVPEFDGRAGAAGQLNIDAAISPQIDTNLSNSFAYGEIAGMGICFGDDSGGPNLASYDNNPGHSSVSGFGTSLSSTGGVAQVAADLDNWLVWFGMNGTWWGVDGSYNPVSGAQANPSTSLHGIPIIHTIYYVGFQAVWTSLFSSGPSMTATLRTRSADGFSYRPPTGFSPWAAGAA